MPDIAILGGGFSGVTTGIVLNLLGADTTIYTARHADHADPTVHHPPFASLYPAASILPHVVQVDELAVQMRRATAFFGRLAQEPDWGVRWQRHAELFEQPPTPPDYVGLLQDVTWLPEDGRGAPGVPKRPGADRVFGWTARMLFAETPIYRPRLYALYRATGGRVVEQRMTPDAIRALPETVLVNCTGLGTRALFPDERPHAAIRGELLHVTPPEPLPAKPAARKAPDRIRSYNYTPAPSVYAAPDGTSRDVYFYPRRDVWVLGGSRRIGTLAPDGTWTGEAIAGPTLEVNGITVPTPVLALNRALIRALTGIDVSDCVERAVYGYRFARDLQGEGVRLERADAYDRAVVHNYGHGGAGVTLSWSCAVAVAHLLQRDGLLSPPPSHRPASPLQADLRALIASAIHDGA